jgi:hypothetical protein
MRKIGQKCLGQFETEDKEEESELTHKLYLEENPQTQESFFFFCFVALIKQPEK